MLVKSTITLAGLNSFDVVVTELSHLGSAHSSLVPACAGFGLVRFQ